MRNFQNATAIADGTSLIGRSRIGRNLIIFFLACFGSATFLNRRPPPPQILSQKIALLNSRNDINLVFIGSSRTHFQISPSAFDDAAHRHNIPATSFNLGLPGALGHEIDYILDTYVLPIPTIKYVFIEIRGFEYQTPDANMRTYRQVYWHDAQRTLDAIITSFNGPLPWGLAVGEAEDHLQHFVMRAVHLWPEIPGNGPPAIARGYHEWRRSGPGEAPQSGLIEARDLSLGEDFLECDRRVLRREQRRAGKRNVMVFYVVPPGAPDFQLPDQMERDGELEHLFRMNTRDRAPALFLPENTGKYESASGARLFSEMLAESFVQTIQEGAPENSKDGENPTALSP